MGLKYLMIPEHLTEEERNAALLRALIRRDRLLVSWLLAEYGAENLMLAIVYSVEIRNEKFVRMLLDAGEIYEQRDMLVLIEEIRLRLQV